MARPVGWGDGSYSTLVVRVVRGLKAVAGRSVLTCLSVALELVQHMQGALAKVGVQHWGCWGPVGPTPSSLRGILDASCGSWHKEH